MKFSLIKALYFIIIAVNSIFLIIAINYFLWFYSNSPEVILDRYISSIKTSEGQLTVRLVKSFDWSNFWRGSRTFEDEYFSFLCKVDNFRIKRQLGKVKILRKQLLGKSAKFTLAVEIDGKIKRGEVVLIRTESEGWRVLSDNALIKI